MVRVVGEGLLDLYFEDLRIESVRVLQVEEAVELSLCDYQFHSLEEMEHLVLLVVV